MLIRQCGMQDQDHDLLVGRHMLLVPVDCLDALFDPTTIVIRIRMRLPLCRLINGLFRNFLRTAFLTILGGHHANTPRRAYGLSVRLPFTISPSVTAIPCANS